MKPCHCVPSMASAALGVVVASLLCTMPAAATDLVVTAPAGWSSTNELDAANGVVAAIIESDATEIYRLLQRRDAGVVETPLPGRAYYVELSPDGTHAIVGTLPMGVGDEPDASTFVVVNATGQVVLTHCSSGTIMGFSLDSARLVEWTSDMGADKAEISVFDLAGTRIGRVKPHRELAGVVGVGAPASVVFSSRGQMTEIDPTRPSTRSLWSVPLVGDDMAIVGLEPMAPDRFVARQSLGWWKLLATDGTVLFAWDPERLSIADPTRGWLDYSGYMPFATTSSSWVLAWGADNSGFLVHVPTRRVTPWTVDAAAPTGFKTWRRIVDSRIAFVSAQELRLRPLPPLPPEP